MSDTDSDTKQDEGRDEQKLRRQCDQLRGELKRLGKDRKEAAAALRKAQAELDALKVVIAGHAQRRLQEETDLANALQAQKTAALVEIGQRQADRWAALETAEQAIDDAWSKLAESTQQAREETALLEAAREDDQTLRAVIRQEFSGEIARLESELSESEARREAAERVGAETQRRSTELWEQAKRFGRPLSEVATDLADLTAQVDQLDRDLRRERDEADHELDRATLRRSLDGAESNLAAARADLAQLHAALDGTRGELLKLEALGRTNESLVATNDSLVATNEALVEAIDERRRDFEDLVSSGEARPPFERMTAMDKDFEKAVPDDELVAPTSLKDLILEIRSRMIEYPLREDRPLSYGIADLRLFVAGLAMSRLHLLEGISGTGKTSLPLAFAAAIGGRAAVVEVQAGWRDRQDLLGHYNTFERRYDETEFIQALYAAQTPQFRRVPCIVVLDEMNLSHPEQYFADVLSALERKEPSLTLTTAELKPRPDELVKGRILRIPDNVWFVGTANHDETTMNFADKTYDRAHVQVLPYRHPPTDEDRVAVQEEEAPSIDVSALEELFTAARVDHKAKADLAGECLVGDVADKLADRFDVGWGNRFEEQVQSFVPVVVAAGGTMEEALDHLVATKILRKIKGRHNMTAGDVASLITTFKAAWPQRAFEGTTSHRILKGEVARLGGETG